MVFPQKDGADPEGKLRLPLGHHSSNGNALNRNSHADYPPESGHDPHFPIPDPRSPSPDPHFPQSGFRLHRMEVYNWGTFDGRIWAIEPGGNTSLLTGENGSGKSTLVDGLITLLVPNRRRSYNQAAGSGGKRERDEHSYVRGAFGKLQSSDAYGGQTQYLRNTGSYSVVLGHFRNEATKRDVTLAQVFWHQDGLKKFYVVATGLLDIATSFGQVSDVSALKRRLRKEGVEVFDQFNQYSQRFCRIFGLRSEKALDLFNQTVMIKEIQRLNDFVRNHMLEKTSALDKVRGLLENFENLTRAYEAIQKAEHQLAILVPLMAEAERYTKVNDEIDDLATYITAAPIYVAEKKQHLLATAIADTQSDLTRYQNQYEQIEAQRVELREQEMNLKVEIGNDTVGQQIQNLEMSIRYAQQEVTRRRSQAEQYDSLVQRFQLPTYGPLHSKPQSESQPDIHQEGMVQGTTNHATPSPFSEETFYQSWMHAEQMTPLLEKQLQSSGEALRQLQIDQEKLSQQRKATQDELTSLQQRRSQIPMQNLTLRTRILEALHIDEEEIPFVGELLRVREKEKVWEGAIERVLHSYGLRLLVPTHHYARFRQYVNETNLRGRIVFNQVNLDDYYTPPRNIPSNALVHKVAIKPETPYYEWIENELQHRFEYSCCETMADFDRSSKAITQAGLIKSGNARHEKDDRRDLRDRSRYILGWDNKNKIEALQEVLSEINQQWHQIGQEIHQAKRNEKEIYQKQQLLQNLLSFEDFATIDWRTEKVKIAELQHQKERLEASSNRLQQLQMDLQAVQSTLDEMEKARQSLDRTMGQLNHQLGEFQRELAECKSEIATYELKIVDVTVVQIEAQLTEPISLRNAKEQLRRIEEHFRTKRERAEERRRRRETSVVKAMQRYKSDYPAETTDFDAAIESVGEFGQEKERIQQDDLPQHRERFKNLLNEKVIENIALLRGDLENYEEDIKESINALNGSLRTIHYTADTYIELQHQQTLDLEIRTFRQELRSCLPDVGQRQSEEGYEESFQRIQRLISRFKEEDRWTQKVTDVRQWLDFSAVEYYRADSEVKEYYSDSAGKSGGQKAKLAYTILASAIAYQYGLEAGDAQPDAFRFVVVDEAFSRSDQENSRYAMELFKELGLQLLVVTPMTGIHVVEPYIATCHFVFNNGEGNCSQVEDMTIRQLRAQREAYQNGTSAARSIALPTSHDHTSHDYTNRN